MAWVSQVPLVTLHVNREAPNLTRQRHQPRKNLPEGRFGPGWNTAFPPWTEENGEARSGREREGLPKLPTVWVSIANFIISSEVNSQDVKQAHLYSNTRQATKHISEPPDVNDSWIIPLLESRGRCSSPLVQIIKTNFLPKGKNRGGHGEQYKGLCVWPDGTPWDKSWIYFWSPGQAIKCLSDFEYTLLRYNLHVIKHTHFNYTTLSFDKCTHSSTTKTWNIFNSWKFPHAFLQLS